MNQKKQRFRRNLINTEGVDSSIKNIKKHRKYQCISYHESDIDHTY